MKDQLVFVDSGKDPIIAKQARDAAEKLTGLQVKTLINTHQHWDHVFGNQVFEDCEIISTKIVLEDMKSFLETHWSEENLEKRRIEEPERYEHLKIVLPTRTFEGSLQIKDDNLTIDIIQGNGHSRGSCFVHIPEEKVLIAGDLLFCKMTPFFGDSTTNIYEWVKVYKKMEELSPEIVIPGHGDVTGKDEISYQLEYYEKCIDWMKDFIKEGNKKEDLGNRKDFPVLGPIPIEGFDVFLELSKEKTYEAVNEKMTKS